MKIRLFPKRRWLRVTLVVIAILIGPTVFSRAASPWRRVALHTTAHLQAQPAPATQLRIASYNIAHGRGLAESNWDGGNSADRLTRLDHIADLLRKMDADVVVLNEVDFDSSWSHSINQAQHLAKKSGYPYRVEQRNFDVRFLTWTWRFGNAVLSRYPITHARVVNLPGYSTVETILAGKKRAIICDIDLGDRTLRVIGAHLSHRSASLRMESAAVLVNLVQDSPHPTIIAGDLNAAPPGFPRAAVDPHGDNAITVFDRSEHLQRFPIAPPPADEYLTFPAANPRSVIDWILIPRHWRFEHYRAEPSELSDHRPVCAGVTFGTSGKAAHPN